MTCILGISAFYHDSAAALVVDGDIVAAAQEERFTRKKHDYRFPQHAIDYCLAEGHIAPGDLDHVAFYDKPLLKFERLLETYLAYAPVGFRLFLKVMPLWAKRATRNLTPMNFTDMSIFLLMYAPLGKATGSATSIASSIHGYLTTMLISVSSKQ